LEFGADGSESWFTVEPTRGSILTANASVEVTLSVLEGDYNVGTFTGTLTLTSTGVPNSPLEVPVSLVVSAP
jgi:hypothetical protein